LRRLDPLRRPPRSTWRRLSAALAFGFAAVVVLLAPVMAAVLLGRLLSGPPGVGEERSAERVVLRISERARQTVAAEPEPAADKADIEIPAEVPERRPPAPRPRRVPPPDPVDLQRPPPEPAAEPRRRVVGVSLESTVEGGAGPAFAVGNTRMGRTGEVAEDPGGIGRLGPARDASAPGGAAAGPNRISSLVPKPGSEIVRPRRLMAVEPDYPAVLRAQGIEGNVGMAIRISTAGLVEEARVVRSSGYREFDEAAREAALKERFSPATRDGRPMEYTLSYTYRFRIRGA